MSQRFLAFLIIIAVASALASQQLTYIPIILGSAEKVTWKTFKDSAGLFSIQYPSKWEARNGTNPVAPIDVEFWYYGDASNMPDTDAMVALVVSPNSEFLTTQDMIKNDQLAIESSGVNFRLEQGTECNAYVINQVQGCSLISSLSFPEQKYGRNVLIVSAVDNSTDIQYSMILSASEDVFEQFKPVFDHMVNSFELNSNALVG
ncbi:MAG: hypothetical protein GEU26_15960 [Nitrososphaeraceae archaeon]|nr:hypothetical protein [Nitrososphaeraceae archaeon]